MHTSARPTHDRDRPGIDVVQVWAVACAVFVGILDARLVDPAQRTPHRHCGDRNVDASGANDPSAPGPARTAAAAPPQRSTNRNELPLICSAMVESRTRHCTLESVKSAPDETPRRSRELG